jgi:hypothetical protein
MPNVDMDKQIVREVPAGTREFTIKGLTPSTIYNVTLIPNNIAGGAWGAYNTLPPGALVVSNLRVCNATDFAVSFSWDALEGDTDQLGTDYRVCL